MPLFSPGSQEETNTIKGVAESGGIGTLIDSTKDFSSLNLVGKTIGLVINGITYYRDVLDATAEQIVFSPLPVDGDTVVTGTRYFIDNSLMSIITEIQPIIVNDFNGGTNFLASAEIVKTLNISKTDNLIADTATETTIELAHNTEYFREEVAILIISFPGVLDSAYHSVLKFTSGAAPTVLIDNTSSKWTGDDIVLETDTYVFTPLANTRYRVTFIYDGAIVIARVSAVKHTKIIHGTSWDKSDTSILTRTDSSINLITNAGVDLTAVRNDFDRREIFKEMHEVTDTLGNVFIRIPKVYIHKSDAVNLKTWQISKHKIGSDWYLPWCFWNFTNNCELPYLDFGKYDASNEIIGGTNRLRSVAGQYPLVNQNIVEFRTRATNNNVSGLAGYQLLDVHAVDLLRTLFFTEFANIDSQFITAGWTGGQYTNTHVAIITESNVNRIIIANAFANLYAVGQPISCGTTQGGNQIFANREITAIDVYDANNKAISFNGAPANIAVGNMLYNSAWKSGFSANIVAKTGSAGSNTTGKFPCVYRGIENPFGNVWQFVDGININNNQSWVCKNSANYASNVFAYPYEQIGYLNANTNNYINETGYDSDYPFIEIPISTKVSSSKYKDYYYQSLGQIVAHFGGYWNYGSNAGLSDWALSYSSATASLNVGSRLLRKPL